MLIIGRNIIAKFKSKHARSRKSLDDWVSKCQVVKWRNFSDMKKTFNSIDKNGNDFIFDIAGNNYRLIAVVQISEGVIKVNEILTHDEYTKKYCKG